jgi:hypothetical protein
MCCFLVVLFVYVLLLASSAVSGFRQGVRARLRSGLQLAAKKVTPNDGESMDAYRKAVLGVLNEYSSASGKFGGRELLELLVTKWGVAYDITLRKSAPFGEASGNIYLNVMWQRFGQKSFRLNEREYLEHLEAIARYIVAMKRVDHFKDKVAECRKRPNSYFGYAVGIPLDVPPETADSFFKDLPYE